MLTRGLRIEIMYSRWEWEDEHFFEFQMNKWEWFYWIKENILTYRYTEIYIILVN